jgi:RND family efflux transporter MFP subunit
MIDKSSSRMSFLTALVLLCAAAGCKEKTSVARLPEATTSGPRVVRTAAVAIAMDRDRIRATGTAAAISTTKVMPLVPGLIRRLPLKEGDIVKRGQVLAVLDQRQYKLTLRQAQAAMEAAQVGLSATTREKERFEKLLKEDATAKAQYDRVLDKYRGAQAQMKQARVALDMAKKALGDTVLTAPYNGIVVKKVASLGDYATSMPPTVILVLQQVSTLEVKISLPEPELQRVEEGAAADVRFPSLDDRKVEAKIARVIRTVNPMTRSFEAVVEIDNSDMSLRPGIYARVQIATAKPRRRLLVPDQAVVDEGSDVFAVFVLEGNTASRREVRVAAAPKEGQTEIVSGLEGDETVIVDAVGLLDGDPVKPRAAATRPKPRAGGRSAATPRAGAERPITTEASR